MLKSIKKIYESDLINIFKKLNLENTKNIFIASDLGSLGIIKNKNFTLNFILNSIKNLNNEINIVVPTSSFQIINSNKTFDYTKTPSYKMGAFSEFIRLRDGSVRSKHPIWSLTCLGPDSKEIFKNISNHAYDENSAFARLYKNDYYFLSLGKHPRFMLSIVHHLETMNKVPYRFKKGFKIKINEENKFLEKEFFLDVLKDEYRQKPRAMNKKIFDTFENEFEVKHFNIGSGLVSFFRIKDFEISTNKLMKKDLYCWFK